MRRSLLVSLTMHGIVLSGLSWIAVVGRVPVGAGDSVGWTLAEQPPPLVTPLSTHPLESERDPTRFEPLKSGVPEVESEKTSRNESLGALPLRKESIFPLRWDRPDPLADGNGALDLETLPPPALPAESVPDPVDTMAEAVDSLREAPKEEAAVSPVPERAPSVVAARPRAAENRPPIYPSRALRRGWEGAVLLEVQLSVDGKVERIRVARSSGCVLLDEAAREAVETWRFWPATSDDRPIASRVEVPVVFRLE